jgi:hypothetical protein
MKKLALKLVLFFVLFFLFDKAFIIIANKSAEAEVDKRLENLIKGKINKEIIVLGSSRGSRDIIAGQIEDSTGLSAYNLCYPGSDMEFHEFLLRTLVKHNESPDYLLLVVDDDIAFLPAERTAFRLDRMYPLVKYRYVIEELVTRGEKDRVFSSIFILNRLNKANFDLRQKRFTPLDSIMACGSMPISWQRIDEDWDFIDGERTYDISMEDTDKLDAYKSIISMCEVENIELVVVFPPNYQRFSEFFEARIKAISSKNVKFYKYQNNPVYLNRSYYYDEEHLIKEGAVIFTNELIRYLNTDLLEHYP